jgi:hypothetical protein
MIKFEHNTLVLDASHTKEDQKAVNDFIEYKIQELVGERFSNEAKANQR